MLLELPEQRFEIPQPLLDIVANLEGVFFELFRGFFSSFDSFFVFAPPLPMLDMLIHQKSTRRKRTEEKSGEYVSCGKRRL